jgi:hypothetical protein
MPSQNAKTYNSFSGVDITPVFGGASIGECQGISYSVSREKAPLYTLGSPNPRAFARGKRGIAGGLVFIVFDRSALFDTLREEDQRFYGNTWEAPDNRKKAAANFTGAQFAHQIKEGKDPAQILGFNVPFTGSNTSIPSKKSMKAYYHDQIPPFNVLLFAATERGHGAIMEVFGIEIVNSGSGVSVDDINMDETCTYVAKNMTPWHSQTYEDPGANYGNPYEYTENMSAEQLKAQGTPISSDAGV